MKALPRQMCSRSTGYPRRLRGSSQAPRPSVSCPSTKCIKPLDQAYHALDQTSQNHEQGYSTEDTFRKQVTSTCDVIVGNPFMDTSHEPVMLETHDCVLHALYTMETAWMPWSCTPYTQWRLRGCHGPARLIHDGDFR